MIIGEAPILISPWVLNWAAEPFMYIITFWIVGLYYDRGSTPILGSFLYLLIYSVNTFWLWLMMTVTEFSTWAIVPLVVVYIMCNVGLAKIRCVLITHVG